MTPLDLVVRIGAILDGLGIDWVLGGSLAWPPQIAHATIYLVFLGGPGRNHRTYDLRLEIRALLVQRVRASP